MIVCKQIFVIFWLCQLYQKTAGQSALPVVTLPRHLSLNSVDKYLSSLKHLNLSNGTECRRVCNPRERRICYRRLRIEHFSAMGPACGGCARGVFADCFRPQCVPTDGFERGIISIDRRLPGPLIEACQYDLMVMDVVNLMHSDSFSVHWHGILQRGTQYMDGVPFVTQCPIIPTSTFRYTFVVQDYGTYFYHSHSGAQRYSGAFGGLIVRQPVSTDLSARFYDDDLTQHTFIISDWSHESPETFYIGLPTRIPGLLPQAILINGKGKFFNEQTRAYTPTPYETFYVTPGRRHRFRFIDAGSTVCPVQIQIQNHKMKIIATDGEDTDPVEVDTLYAHTGERFDVVVEANQTPGLYWMHIRSVGFCADLNISQNAVMSYGPIDPRSDIYPPQRPAPQGFPLGIIMNHPEMDCEDTVQNLCIKDLRSPASPASWQRKADYREYFQFNNRQLNTTEYFASGKFNHFFNIDLDNIYRGSINGISNVPTTYPLLTQGKLNNFDNFCNNRTVQQPCEMGTCLCNHIVTLPQNSLVEFILFEENADIFPVVHPIHIHGHKFIVLAQGRILDGGALTVERMRQLELQGRFRSNNPNPVLKDTICVQNRGFAVVRLVADNPGAWMLHCHVEDHMVFGMTLTLAVNGYIPPPPRNFPKCGNFPLQPFEEEE